MTHDYFQELNLDDVHDLQVLRMKHAVTASKIAVSPEDGLHPAAQLLHATVTAERHPGHRALPPTLDEL